MDERSERLARILNVPLLIAALLTVPVIVIEQRHMGGAWKHAAAIANWAIWSVFAFEVVAMLLVLRDRRPHAALPPELAAGRAPLPAAAPAAPDLAREVHAGTRESGGHPLRRPAGRLHRPRRGGGFRGSGNTTPPGPGLT